MEKENLSGHEAHKELFLERLGKNDLVVVAKNESGQWRCCYGVNCSCTHYEYKSKWIERVVYRSIRRKGLFFRYRKMVMGDNVYESVYKFDIKHLACYMAIESDLEFKFDEYNASLRKWKLRTVLGKGTKKNVPAII